MVSFPVTAYISIILVPLGAITGACSADGGASPSEPNAGGGGQGSTEATGSPTTTSANTSEASSSNGSTTTSTVASNTVSTSTANTSTTSTSATTVGSTTTSTGGTGGSSSTGNASTTGGGTGSGGATGELGSGMMVGSGMSSDRYEEADVSRNGVNYVFMANGWGPGFQSQTVSWNGTSFIVESMQGSQGPNYEPASYPTVFCGVYSSGQSGECGLPASLDSITSLRTGWRWNPNGSGGQYNAAYDIWVGNGNSFGGYLMVWLREPPGQQPAGSQVETQITVENVPGAWNIWTGTVNNFPIINWVRGENQDSYELEFDIMDFIRDAESRGMNVPGDQIRSVAVGFEIWNGPVENLESIDFYVDVN